MKEGIIACSFAFCALLLLSFSITTFVQLNTSDYTYLQGMGTNWSSGPILSVNSKTLQCAEGEELIIQDEWHGTSEGCYCPHSFDIFYGSLREGGCRDNRDSLLFCSTVRPIAPIDYSSYRGRKICGKRTKASYLDLSVATNDKSCPMDQKSCGVVDSMKNILCMDKDSACPMNDIKIIDRSDNEPDDFKYTKVEAGDKDILFTNENTKGNIIAQFKISDDQPCILPFYENTKGTLYLLDALQGKGECKRGIGDTLYDDNYKKIDTYNMKSLLQENQITAVLNTLPEFPLEAYNRPVNLYVKNYIGVNPSCLKDIKANNLSLSILEELVNMEAKMSKNLILSLVVMILVIIASVFGTCFACFSYSDDKTIKIVLACLPVTLSFVNIILCIILVSGIGNIAHHYSSINNPMCVDAVTYEAISNFEGKVGSAYFANLMTLGLSFILFGGPIATIILI
jgi:hypothetical protein